MKHPALFCLLALLMAATLAVGCVTGWDVPAYGSDLSATDGETPIWESYLAQHVTLHTFFRSMDTRLNSALGSRHLGNQVVQGEHGFLFLSETLGQIPGEAELTRAADHLEALKESAGVPLVVCLAPNKSTALYTLLPGKAQGDTLRLFQAMLEERGITVIDALSLLENREDLWCQTDSHWNGGGTGRAAQAILSACGDASLSQLPSLRTEGVVGDLALLAWPDRPAAEPAWVPELPGDWRADKPIRTLMDLDIRTKGTGTLRLVVWRDSFGSALLPYLAESCGRLVFLRNENKIASALRQEQPDALVVVLAERRISELGKE